MLLYAILFLLNAHVSALYNCAPENNVTYTDGKTISIPLTTEDNHYAAKTNCLWTIIIPSDKYIELQIIADFDYVDDQHLYDKQIFVTSDYGIRNQYLGTTVNDTMQILPSTATIQLASTTSGSFRFTIKWFQQRQSSPTLKLDVKKNDYNLQDMKVMNSLTKTALTFQATDPNMKITLASTRYIDDISRNIWMYDSADTSGVRIATLYDASANPINSSKSALTVFYPCDAVLPSGGFIAADSAAIAQFSTYGFKSDPNTNVGEEYLYTSCTSCPTNLKPTAFSYYQFDNQPMTLTKINYHGWNGTLRVYQRMPTGEAVPLLTYSPTTAIDHLPQMLPGGSLVTVTLDTGAVTLWMFPDDDDPSPSDDQSYFLAPYLVRDKREGHIYSNNYGISSFTQDISIIFKQAKGYSDLYIFSYSFVDSDMQTGARVVVFTDLDSKTYELGVPVDELHITGTYFGVNYTVSGNNNKGLDVKYRMDFSEKSTKTTEMAVTAVQGQTTVSTENSPTQDNATTTTPSKPESTTSASVSVLLGISFVVSLLCNI